MAWCVYSHDYFDIGDQARTLGHDVYCMSNYNCTDPSGHPHIHKGWSLQSSPDYSRSRFIEWNEDGQILSYKLRHNDPVIVSAGIPSINRTGYIVKGLS